MLTQTELVSQIDPADNFSGQIKIDVTAITTEGNNPLAGKDTARSVTEEIVIDVNPVADAGSFTVNRINILRTMRERKTP